METGNSARFSAGHWAKAFDRRAMKCATLLGAIVLSGLCTPAQEPTDAERDNFAAEAKKLNAEGVQAYRQGRVRDATDKMQAALSLRRKAFPESLYPDGHRDLAQSLNNLGSLYQAQRLYDDALPYYEQALAMRQKLYPPSKFPDGSPDLAFSLNNLGFLLESQGSYERARPYLEQSLAMRRKLYPETAYPDGHPELAMSLINLGVLLKEQGSYERARPYHEQALAMLRKLYPESKHPDGHPDLAASLNNLGSLLEDHGAYEEARPYLEQALAMRRRLHPPEKAPDGHPDLATSLNNMGCLLEDQGAYDRAQPFLEQALAMLRKLYPEDRFPDGHPYLAYSLNNLGCLLEAQGSYGQARTYYEQALTMRRKLYPAAKYPGGHPDLAQSLHSLGFLQARGSFEQARPYLEQALAMRRKIYPPQMYPDGHPELVQSLDTLGLLFQVMGSYDGARSYYEEALAMKRKLASEIVLAASEAEALAAVQVRLLARDGYLSLAARFPDAAASAYRAVWDSKSAITRVLELRHATARANAKAREQFTRLQEVHRRVEQLRHETRLKPEERDQQMARLTAEREQLEGQLSRELPILARWEQRDNLKPDDLLKALPAGSAFVDLLAYTHFEQDAQVKGKAGLKLTPSYVAFVLAPGRPLQRVELGSAEPIDAAVRTWRLAIEQRQNGPPPQELSSLVWEPIAKFLPSETRTLYVAPDGDLARIPWAALPVAPGNVLLERYALATTPHGPFLLEQLGRKPESVGVDSVLTVGDVAYGDSDWTPLPIGRAEVGAILPSAPTPPRSLSVNEATAAALIDALPKARFAHLATHGEFRADEPAAERRREMEALKGWQEGVAIESRRIAVKNPLGYVGLVLSQGRILSGVSILDLPLENLHVVTLSATETGLAERTGGEGVQGLQRAFHLAGCPNVIATLWKMNDPASAAILAKFYHELWVGKKPPIEALREAQLTIYRRPDLIADLSGAGGAEKLKQALGVRSAERAPAEAGRRADTRLWAAFTLSGSGQ